MADIEDLINELYAIDNSLWSVNLENILKLLSFPVHLGYTCDKDEFLYEYSGKISAMSTRDRKILSDCNEIAEYRTERRFKKIRMFGIRLSGNVKVRNETVYDIYNVFAKLYGRYTMLAVVSNGELCYVGLSVNRKKHAEVVISEWFGYRDDCDKLNKLLEIDFSLFNSRYLGGLYNEYVWAISREYICHPESRMYLIYGCDPPITYETYVESPNSDEPVLTTRLDREVTLEKNSLYYRDLYGWDYFADDSNIEIEEEFMLGEDDAEFEWTMLEMELAEGAAEDELYDDDEYYLNSDEDDEDYDEELIGMNPEEMLDYIRNNK